jgi:hypothetical protein
VLKHLVGNGARELCQRLAHVDMVRQPLKHDAVVAVVPRNRRRPDAILIPYGELQCVELVRIWVPRMRAAHLTHDHGVHERVRTRPTPRIASHRIAP